jgi:hypothetical protein
LKNPSTITCDWGEGPDYFRFAPQFKAAAFPGKGPVTFKNHCFEENTAEIINYTNTTVTLRITSSGKSSWFCDDHYLLSTLNIHHLDTIVLGGTHEYVFKDITALDMDDIQREGVRVFAFCDDLEDLVADVWMTLKMFLGGFTTHPDWPFIGSHVTPWMVENNLEFLRQSIGYDM